MGYKLLGYVVWRGSRWHLGRRYAATGRKVAIGGAAIGAVALGAAAATSARQRA